MLLSVVMYAKPLCHRNVNIKLYINQIYVNTLIHREFTLRKSQIKYICKRKKINNKK